MCLCSLGPMFPINAMKGEHWTLLSPPPPPHTLFPNGVLCFLVIKKRGKSLKKARENRTCALQSLPGMQTNFLTNSLVG